MDVPAALMFPTSVSSRQLNAIIYDGRPAILPVSIRLADLEADDVLRSWSVSHTKLKQILNVYILFIYTVGVACRKYELSQYTSEKIHMYMYFTC